MQMAFDQMRCNITAFLLNTPIKKQKMMLKTQKMAAGKIFLKKNALNCLEFRKIP